MTQVIEVNTDAELVEAIKEGKVLVDFYASWCGPCKMLGGVLTELAAEREDIKVVKYDIDKSEGLTEKLGVMSVPTLFVYQDNVKLINRSGFAPKQALNEWINTV